MKRLAAAAALLAVLAGTAVAVITPLRLGFQGKLIDPATNLPRNGNVLMKFVLYDGPLGGANTLASDPVGGGFVSVPVSNGVFSYSIGTGTLLTADMFRGASVYVGVQVSGDAEMTPRLPLSMSAYSFTSMQLVSDSDIRVNSGIAYSTFTTGGNLQLMAGVAATTGSFSAQGNSVYSLFSSSGLFMSSGTLKLAASGRGMDATGTGVVASTGVFLGVGDGVFSIVTSSGIKIQGGILQVAATGGVQVDYGVVASTGFFKGGKDAEYSLITSSGIRMMNGTLQLDATGGMLATYGIVASTALFRAASNGVYGLQVTSGVFVASGTIQANNGGGIDATYGVTAGTGTFNAVVFSTAGGIVTLTVDNQLVTVGHNTASPRSFIKLTSDNATSTNRTFCLGPADPGHVLFIAWVDQGTNEGELLDGSLSGAGSCTAPGAVIAQLTALWPAATLQPNDSIVLIYTGLFWVEVGRAAN